VAANGETLRYLVCYDIPVTSRRTKLAKCLDDYGGRVQYSVFEMVLDHRLFDNLVADLTTLVEPSQDRVIIYPICAACRKKAVFLGLAELETRPGDELVFIV
jgi:CRISPR-associated protein Cas2